MTNQAERISQQSDPEGSIFLFKPLSERGYQDHYFAMLMGRGEYRDMEVEDIEDHMRELKLRRALTERAMGIEQPSASV